MPSALMNFLDMHCFFHIKNERSLTHFVHGNFHCTESERDTNCSQTHCSASDRMNGLPAPRQKGQTDSELCLRYRMFQLDSSHYILQQLNETNTTCQNQQNEHIWRQSFKRCREAYQTTLWFCRPSRVLQGQFLGERQLNKIHN